MLTIIYVSNHDHGSSMLSACSVSLNTADGMAFKQNSKKISTYMERDSNNEAAISPVEPQAFSLWTYSSCTFQEEKQMQITGQSSAIRQQCFHSHHENFSLSLFSPRYIQTYSQEDKVYHLFYSKENQRPSMKLPASGRRATTGGFSQSWVLSSIWGKKELSSSCCGKQQAAQSNWGWWPHSDSPVHIAMR